eukprot:3766398-Alexandrium_andersonii.AAC.1
MPVFCCAPVFSNSASNVNCDMALPLRPLASSPNGCGCSWSAQCACALRNARLRKHKNALCASVT